MGALAAALLIALAGCTTVPFDYPRDESHAVPIDPATTLGGATLEYVADREESAFFFLAGGALAAWQLGLFGPSDGELVVAGDPVGEGGAQGEAPEAEDAAAAQEPDAQGAESEDGVTDAVAAVEKAPKDDGAKAEPKDTRPDPKEEPKEDPKKKGYGKRAGQGD